MTESQIDQNAVRVLVEDYNFPEIVAIDTVENLRNAGFMQKSSLEDISEESLAQLKAKFGN